jgi:hypothetical protein
MHQAILDADFSQPRVPGSRRVDNSNRHDPLGG